MQISYKAKSGKTASLEINTEKIMQQITEKNQGKIGIRPCNVSLPKIDTRFHCESFRLQQFLLEDISEEIDVRLLYPNKGNINESKVGSLEIQKSALPNTKMLDEYKLKQLKVDLLCNLRAELKNMLAESEIDTNVNIKTTLKNT